MVDPVASGRSIGYGDPARAPGAAEKVVLRPCREGQGAGSDKKLAAVHVQTVSDGARGLYGVNPRIVFKGRACLGPFEGGEAVARELRGVDAFAAGQVWGELAESLAELTRRADGIATLVVIERDGEVDDGLEEETARSALVRPDLFEHFVADEEFAAVEEID